jgi:membrane protease YdiL (CAAX protease family)
MAINSSHRYPWRLFFLLLFSAIASVLALLPYLQGVLGPTLAAHPLPLPLPVVVLIQGTLNFSVATGLGLLAARALGLGAPVLEDLLYGRPPRPARRPIAMVSVLTGFILGMVALLLIISPAGAPLRSIAPSETVLPLWKRLLACTYGGLGEEILMRLFLLSVLLWIFTKIFRASARNSILFWSANLLVALAFGAGHLPIAASLHILTPSLVVTVIGLNAFVGLAFGYLYWSRGLEAAMLAHFTADLVLHLVGPSLVKS